ncbi:hypothetical protein CMQ_3639 [Grosmannia clavigera kw1407]|uniref:Protein kinase domain-containing protein n=1 Tax=Grosmannia clavigera (strain kw1407 / UAMH 11150) TaxID=655863 RepID=F0X989_GROCL|nr:uncharacterized protein CMQ_3639 [Grosmannia clavigera kw1407]EFX05570.1 hypothetical protein CMQ_3639 [Grosmannia clavigera kw1407]
MGCLLDLVARCNDYILEGVSGAQDWLPLRRKTDGQQFVGQVLSLGDGRTWLDRLLTAGHIDPPPGQDSDADNDNDSNTFYRALQRLLRHDNLVSIAAFVAVQLLESVTAQVAVVWDRCDAGSLDVLLHDLPRMAEMGVYRGVVGCRDEGTVYLPESLCWHVVRSVLRALSWLHDGDGNPVQDGWMPVLHNAVQPANIFFQHPRGRETYGLCKLGNYSRCFVSGHIVGPHARRSLAMKPPVALAAAPNPLSVQANDLVTRGTDMAALGEVLHHMMTGRPWTSAARKLDDQHNEARDKDVATDANAGLEGQTEAEDGDKYTHQLELFRRRLLQFADLQNCPAEAGTAAMLLEQARLGFEAWRSSTLDGRQHV